PGPAPAEAPPVAAAPAAPASAARQPSASYVGRLLAALDRHKDYPSSARFRRAEGVALLRFTMRRDGSVAAWQIERSSGHRDLDAAVEQMIRRASPLPAPPPELAGDPVEIVVPVRFSLR
ncbi:energy transducer TonB, partial [Crenalkalicoccus roseus]|uniref:energy transducer TonB n=1 Tax=Crenalkalicoccus roseus TaxID=1485588 RepID=UPI0010821881